MVEHNVDTDLTYRKLFNFELRECIGKTDDIRASLCMHSAIVAREMAAKGIVVCRVCGKPLPEGKGRFNDHKVLRHPNCVQPICVKCADENPDEFYIAFKSGVEEMNVAPLYVKSAELLHEIEKLTQITSKVGR